MVATQATYEQLSKTTMPPRPTLPIKQKMANANAITYDLSGLKRATNDIYYPLYTNKDRYLVLYGGAGSGKSHFIAQKYLVRIMAGESAFPNVKRHRILALRKTQPAAKKSVFALFQFYIDLWGLGSRCKINHTDMVITFKRSKSQIICAGLDDPTKIKSIEGVTSIWMEEATEFTHTDFLQLDLRLRGKHLTYLQICISFNPVECKWLKEEFFSPKPRFVKKARLRDISTSPTTRYRRMEKVVEIKKLNKIVRVNSTVLLTTYLDNRYLDDQQIANIVDLQHKDLTWYQIYGLGQWGAPKGQVYQEGLNWDTTSEWPGKKRFRHHGFGLDFGYSNHPTGVVEVGIMANMKDLYVREVLYEKALTNPDICEKLTAAKLNRYDLLVADSAEPKSIEEIKRGGFAIIGSRKGKDSIINGITVTKQYNIHVFSDSLNLIKERRNYKWKEDKEGNSLNIPVDAWNHLLDAERYIITTLVGFKAKDTVINLGNRYHK